MTQIYANHGPKSSPAAPTTREIVAPDGTTLPVLAPLPENIPDALKAIPHWVVWRAVPKLKGGTWKLDKVPHDPHTGSIGDATDPEKAASFEVALACYERGNFHGLGIQLHPETGLVGHDLDACFEADGSLTPEAQRIVMMLPSYAEISPSTTGIRIFTFGRKPGPKCRRGTLEMYESGRFLTVTGHRLDGAPAEVFERQEAIEAVYAEHLAEAPPPPPANGRGPQGRPEGPSLSDAEILEKAMAARSGDTFRQLWQGRTALHDGDDSAADLALCNHLAFWTGSDTQRIDALFRQSGLMRPKWDERRGALTYGHMTIQKAIADAGAVYAGRNGHRQVQGAQRSPSHFALTDYGNAERLVSQHGADLHYCFPLGTWFVWDAGRWSVDSSGEVTRRAKATARKIRAEAAEEPDKDKAAKIFAHALKSESETRLGAMVNLARSEPGIPVQPDELDRDAWKLCVKNGTIDLRTGSLEPHRREDLITKLAPVRYDPGAQCPRWMQFLGEIFAGDADLIAYVQRAAGYAATGDVSEQCIFIPYGSGCNGKGTFLGRLEGTLGDYAQATRPELLLAKSRTGGPSEGEAALRGARLVTTSETGDGQRFDEATLKRLTGGDTVRARFLHSNEVEFRPSHKLWLSTNHKPTVRDTTFAMWRRIHLIPFTEVFGGERRDASLDRKLDAERSGILNWIIEGCLQWQRIGLQPPAAVVEATRQYQAEMDVLAGFLQECCETGMPEMQVQASRLYRTYKVWCEETGERADSQRGFGLRLTERGYARERKSDGFWYRGLGLKAPPQGDDA